LCVNNEHEQPPKQNRRPHPKPPNSWEKQPIYGNRSIASTKKKISYGGIEVAYYHGSTIPNAMVLHVIWSRIMLVRFVFKIWITLQMVHISIHTGWQHQNYWFQACTNCRKCNSVQWSLQNEWGNGIIEVSSLFVSIP
jgi:hypothetical protein